MAKRTDRRFSNFTTWINNYQLNARISSIKEMVNVLREGVIGSNKKRMEVGKKPIPTFFTIFELERRNKLAPCVNLENITRIASVTYIPKIGDRISPNDTGFYIIVLPWIPWRKGRPILSKYICGGRDAEVPAAKCKLRPEHKPAGDNKKDDFSSMKKDHI